MIELTAATGLRAFGTLFQVTYDTENVEDPKLTPNTNQSECIEKIPEPLMTLMRLPRESPWVAEAVKT